MVIRKAKYSDMLGALLLIQELANFEHAADEVEITVKQLQQDGFGEGKVFDCIVAEHENEIIGMALYYYRYSTWKGKTIYLEDLVVKESERRKGLGGKLFEKLASECKLLGVKRFEWQVLDWNQAAIDFYRKYKANLDEEWINCKLTEEQLKEF
jgi:GNAT superfamily N-acetyltransferase